MMREKRQSNAEVFGGERKRQTDIVEVLEFSSSLWQMRQSVGKREVIPLVLFEKRETMNVEMNHPRQRIEDAKSI